MRRIKKVNVLGDYRLELIFDDGATGNVNLSNLVVTCVRMLCISR